MICCKDLFVGHEDPGSRRIRFSTILSGCGLAVLILFLPQFRREAVCNFTAEL
jgi:hypothetical protein